MPGKRSLHERRSVNDKLSPEGAAFPGLLKKLLELPDKVDEGDAEDVANLA